MSDSRLDPEQLAALLDDRLGGHERARLLAELGADPDTLALLADATVAANAATPGARIPGHPAGKRVHLFASAMHNPRGLWISAIAAALVGVAVLRWHAAVADGGDVRDPAAFSGDLVVPDPDFVRRVSEGQRAATRGSRPTGSPSADAVRVGELITDVEIAVRRIRDGAGSYDSLTAALVGELIADLDQLGGGGPAARAFRDVRDRLARGQTPTLDDASLAATAVGSDLVTLGAWLQAAAFAADLRDSSFFVSKRSRALLEHSLAAPSVPDDARLGIRRLQARTQRGGAIDWKAVSASLIDLMRALAAA